MFLGTVEPILIMYSNTFLVGSNVLFCGQPRQNFGVEEQQIQTFHPLRRDRQVGNLRHLA